MLAVTHGLLCNRRLPKISPAVSVIDVLKMLIGVSTSVASTSSMVTGANFPPCVAWKASLVQGL